ncbi:MAG: nodulation protein NfeD [Chloroflexia bacterium]|nr:nodulation protein NfeD [Chloroflexia bacterium]
MVGLYRGVEHRRQAGRRETLAFLTVMTLLLAALSVAPGAVTAQNTMDSEGPVYVVPIHGAIDLGVAHYLRRALEEAEAGGARMVVLDLDTPGGRLDAVLQMRDAILDTGVPTVAYVNREAFSAGALITIASERIYLAPGAVYGAATPVDGSGETAGEKTISAVRSTFRATAERRGRDPAIAAAMVDPAVVVPGLDDATSLLTLTTDEALAHGYAEGTAPDLTALLDTLGAADAEVVRLGPSGLETIVRWVTDPVVASLLIMLGLFLIVGDALFEGFGIAAVAGLVCIGLFFWGHLLAGLAGWEDFVLIGLGVALIGLEIFVIPGFGVAGILGIAALGGGFFLAMLGRDIQTPDQMVRAGWVVAGALLAVLAALIVVALLLPRMAGGRRGGFARLALTDRVGVDVPARSRAQSPAGRRRGLGGWLGGGDVLERDDDRPPPGGPRWPATERPNEREEPSSDERRAG